MSRNRSRTGRERAELKKKKEFKRVVATLTQPTYTVTTPNSIFTWDSYVNRWSNSTQITMNPATSQIALKNVTNVYPH